MPQPLYLTFLADETSRRWGLSIHLDPGSYQGTDSAWLRGLHAAADVWREQHPDVFLRSDLTVEAERGFHRAPLPHYLYSSGDVNQNRLVRHLSMLRGMGGIHRFSIRPGAVAEGQDLVGRESTVDRLLGLLETGSGHLRAPRRYGKSSVLRRLATELADRGQACVSLEVSNSRTVSAFLLVLARAAVETPACRTALASIPELSNWPDAGAGPIERNEAIRRLQARIESSPWSFAGRLLDALGTLRSVLLIDEFSIFLRAATVRAPEEARQLIDLLARSRRSDQPTRQIFAGSAGLSSYIRFHKLGSAFEDLVAVDLPPLDTTGAAMLAEELLYTEGLTPCPEVVDKILEMVGDPIPYFVHALAGALAEEAPSREPISPEMVNLAYSRRILGDRGQTIFRIYRLSDQPYPAPLRRAAAGMLREIVRSPLGAEKTALRQIFTESTEPGEVEQFESLLSCLQEDYDLVPSDGRWRMRGKVMRDRWSLAEAWLTEDSP
jgi:hypothetical protein